MLLLVISFLFVLFFSNYMLNLSQVGICRLLEENGFAAAFPLHDGQFDLPKVVVLLPECYK